MEQIASANIFFLCLVKNLIKKNIEKCRWLIICPRRNCETIPAYFCTLSKLSVSSRKVLNSSPALYTLTYA
ncbi:unnamed protein product [Brugia timori]|uniref:Uncharacterized protein n=1 Tax=Brugia timori TaxID=42155 RepID=A0A0R3QLS5_9BILA|nr:unnamed protein product [Brugia timori]